MAKTLKVLYGKLEAHVDVFYKTTIIVIVGMQQLEISMFNIFSDKLYFCG